MLEGELTLQNNYNRMDLIHSRNCMLQYNSQYTCFPNLENSTTMCNPCGTPFGKTRDVEMLLLEVYISPQVLI